MVKVELSLDNAWAREGNPRFLILKKKVNLQKAISVAVVALSWGCCWSKFFALASHADKYIALPLNAARRAIMLTRHLHVQGLLSDRGNPAVHHTGLLIRRTIPPAGVLVFFHSTTYEFIFILEMKMFISFSLLYFFPAKKWIVFYPY